jgi:hypothetical protein
MHQQTQRTPLLLLLLVISSIAVVYIWPTLVGVVAGALFICYAGLGLWSLRTRELPRRSRVLVAFMQIVFLTVVFGDVYFALLRFSSYPDQYFRVSPDARIGHALDRITARHFLADIHADLQAFLKQQRVDVSVFRNNEEFTWLISSGLMYEFAGPGPELSEDLDQSKLDVFAHSLALSRARLHRYYRSEMSAKYTYSEQPLSLLVIGWISPNSEKELDNTKYNVAMLLAAEKLLEQFSPSREVFDGRELYLGALFFSSMLFMTSGYSDILPNSNLTFLLMGTQFIVYVVVFLFMIPLAL